MTLIYKPIAVALGVFAGFVGRKLFEQVWGVIDDAEPPKPNTQRATWTRVLVAAALEGLIFRGVRAAVERAGASGFHSLTGSWPGEKEPEPE